MKNNNEIYFNAPVQLLEGFLIDKNKNLDDILYYALYARSLKLDYNSEQERFIAAADYMNVNLINSDMVYIRGKELYNSIDTDSPMIGISRLNFWEFRDNTKSEWDCVCLLGFLALKTIIGNKEYSKTTNNLWYARMDGKVKSIENASELSINIQKYYSEYKSRRLRKTLELEWHMPIYCQHTKGFYFTIKGSKESIVTIAEQRKSYFREKIRREEEKAIIKKVKSRLKTGEPIY